LPPVGGWAFPHIGTAVNESLPFAEMEKFNELLSPERRSSAIPYTAALLEEAFFLLRHASNRFGCEANRGNWSGKPSR